MLKKFLIILGIIGAFSLSGCSVPNDEANFHFSALKITTTDVPTSFELNKSYEIPITYIKSNGCTLFDRFEVENEAKTVRNIIAIGFVQTNQEQCTNAPIEETTTLNFTVLYTDTYIFKFYKGEDADGKPEFIEIEIPVNTP